MGLVTGPARDALFVSEQLFAVLDKADDYDDCRPRQANEEHEFKQSNYVGREVHKFIVTAFKVLSAMKLI